jgi:hypothetical protein
MSQGLLRVRGRSGLGSAIVAASLVCAVMVAGCTYTTDSTGPGALAVQPLGTVPAVPRPAPPPSADVPPGPPPSGMFSGIAHLTNRPATGCRREIDIDQFIVSGNRVRYMGFRGTIRPDLSVRLQSGQSYITGHFVDDRFVGQFWRPQPSCTYHLELRRVS